MFKEYYNHINPTRYYSYSWYGRLSEEDKLVVARAKKIQRFLSQPFFVAEVFTGSPGKLVDLDSTIKVLMQTEREYDIT
ncbi:MAG: hypothetical protein CM1200mP13_11000 [Candidatus Pelagibacterales bacterium]|nr:MAG: hypothetical protein CM1200mP13_11000 [Pelagibacterales bacterium]